MRISSATAVNLSVLTADFYSLIIGIFLFQYKYHPLYFASFGLIIIGVIVFFSKSTNPVESSNLRNIVPHTSSVEYSQVPITSELEPSEVRLLSANSDAAGTSKSANYSALKGQTTCSNKQRVTIENSFVEGQKTTVNIENQNTPKRNGIVKPNQTDSNRL
ncbi:SLC35F1 (predicted) [Pycnogonum litorale]